MFKHITINICFLHNRIKFFFSLNGKTSQKTTITALAASWLLITCLSDIRLYCLQFGYQIYFNANQTPTTCNGMTNKIENANVISYTNIFSLKIGIKKSVRVEKINHMACLWSSQHFTHYLEDVDEVI